MTDAPPPVAKYRYTLQITGNSLDEVEDELQRLAKQFGYETAHRDELAIQSGTYTQTLVVVDREQTPEKYEAALEEWMMKRKEVSGGEE